MSDIIKESLASLSTPDLNTILLNNCVTIVISFFIMLTYRLTYSGTAYSKKFNVSLGMLAIVTTLIMSVISNNVALSLGMVGALSIIRFRTAVKDARDATFIFWCIAVGVSCGVSHYIPAAITSVFLFLFLLVTNKTGADSKRLLIVRCGMDAQNKVEATIDQHFGSAASQRMKNASLQACELVYELTRAPLQGVKKPQVDIVEKLLKIEGVFNVNQVEQSDDISR